MKVVESDSDLPNCLNTRRKQVAKAKSLAESHLEEPALKACPVPIQGFFSRTLFVTMKSGEECVIQFRVEPINIQEFSDARSLLGDVVPKICKLSDQALERDGVMPYYMSLVPGTPWISARNEVSVTALSSLGRVLSRGYVADNSAAVVENLIIPKLQILLDSVDERRKPFQPLISTLIDNVAQLKTLPLFVSHADLNHVNILLSEDGEVSGIVDWEGASNLPFGMGFSRIHDLAGEFIDGEFRIPDNFEAAERGFWNAVFDCVPPAAGRNLENNLEAVQMSVTVGSLLENLDSEHGLNEVALKALPRFLKYRIPALRRSEEPPYGQ